MDDRPIPLGLERLAEALGIGIIVQSVDAGPPAVITASFLLDTRVFDVTATGSTEDDAWDELGRKAMQWKNDDERNVRNWFGGV